MSGQQFSGPPKNATDNNKLQLQGDPWEPGSWEKPGGLLRVVNNNVWLTVYANHPQDKGAKPINVKMDVVLAGIFLEQIKAAIADPNFEGEGIENSNYTYPGGKRSDKPEVLTKLWVLRNSAGEIAVRVAERGRKYQPVLKFAPSRWFAIIDKDGNVLDPGRVSQRIASGWANMLSEIIPTQYVGIYEHKDAKKDGKGGGNARSNNGGGGNSGGGWDDSGSGDVFSQTDGF